METRPERPFGVTVLTIINLIGALWALVGGLFLTFMGAIFLPIPIAGIMLIGIAMFKMVIGLIGLLVTYGLWTGRSWAWWLALILAVLNILSIIGGNIVMFIIGIILVYYLTRPHVRAFFNVS